MNEYVKQFIDRRKKEVATERKKLLAEIPEFQIREYSDQNVVSKDYPYWDVVKHHPYRISDIVDVSEDDFELMKNYLQQEKQEKEIRTEGEGLVKPSNAADKALAILAIIVLVLAFVGLIIGFVGLIDVGYSWWDPTLLIVGFSSFVLFFIEWATLRLLINISVRLRQINNNLRDSI